MFSKKMALFVGLFTLIALSILSLSLSSRQLYSAHVPGRIVITLVAPLQKAVMGASRFMRNIWEHYFFLISVVEENVRLRKELRQAKSLHHDIKEARLMNARLRRMLGLAREMEREVIAAQVVGKDPSAWFQSIMVDKGSAAGVVKGQPVVNPEGIVGIVINATTHYAKVMLLTDPNSAVDAVVRNSRARGIIKGGAAGHCVFNFVLRKHDVSQGDAVVASGMDGVFPKGSPVGEVATIIKHEAGIFQDVTVTPYVDFERLEEVLIVPVREPDRAP